MPSLILGLLILVLGLWLLRTFARTDPKVLVRSGKAGGGIVALALAAFLFFRGRVDMAIALGGVGLGLLGWLPFGPAGFGARTRKSAGQVSRVRTAALAMELDHDSGRMSGEILTGRHAGHQLDALDIATLAAWLSEIDAESRALLVAYLDRRDARWREHANAGAADGETFTPDSGKMTDEQAYKVLGIEPGAGRDAIVAAHRVLMKKLHPDQGGSTYLAALINQAKEILLRRHR